MVYTISPPRLFSPSPHLSHHPHFLLAAALPPTLPCRYSHSCNHVCICVCVRLTLCFCVLISVSFLCSFPSLGSLTLAFNRMKWGEPSRYSYPIVTKVCSLFYTFLRVRLLNLSHVVCVSSFLSLDPPRFLVLIDAFCRHLVSLHSLTHFLPLSLTHAQTTATTLVTSYRGS